jgi:hypothetical protein
MLSADILDAASYFYNWHTVEKIGEPTKPARILRAGRGRPSVVGYFMPAGNGEVEDADWLISDESLSKQ